MCTIWEHVPNWVTPPPSHHFGNTKIQEHFTFRRPPPPLMNLGTLILVSLVVLTLRPPNQGGNFNLIVVLTLRTANQGGNFHNIVVITQIRGVIRSFWGHNKTHFSFGIGNILPDPLPPHKMFPSLNLGMSEAPPPPIWAMFPNFTHFFLSSSLKKTQEVGNVSFNLGIEQKLDDLAKHTLSMASQVI